VAFIAVIHVHMCYRYFRVSRLVVLPDYQGVGIGKRLLNFIAELYTSQMRMPFFIVTSNPQIVRGNLENWKVKRVGHAAVGLEDSGMNRDLRDSLSHNRLSISLQHTLKKRL
jgi:GNAT superfamily N-acetyltransferase